MDTSSGLLVVAATQGELAIGPDWVSVACGVGPVEAAASTTEAILTHRPRVLLHVGIAGARRRRALPPASLVIGSAAQYCDPDGPTEWSPRVVYAPPSLLALAQRVLPAAPVVVIGTSARVGGTIDCDVEAMEGFGVLRAAQRLGVPAIEVRAISNEIEEEDRARWQFAAALEAITRCTPLLVRAMQEDAAQDAGNA